MCKIGTVNVSEADAARYYAEDAYVVTHSDVYQISFSHGCGCYYGLRLSALHGHKMVRRGCWRFMTAKEINAEIGRKVLHEWKEGERYDCHA